MKSILVVDDEPMILMAHKRMLEDQFYVSTLDSGAKVCAFVQKHKPDLVLLDLALPDFDGFKVCKQLETSALLNDTAVIIVSGNSDLSTRIKAFDCGADDFIKKPLDPEELLSKLNVISERRKEQQDTQKELSETRKAMMAIMSNSSELGRAMNFIERSYELHTVKGLINEVQMLFSSYDLQTTIAVSINGQKSYFSSLGKVKPIESELLDLLAGEGRFYDFKQRSQVNYPHISVLIKNMPVDNQDFYGRIKDLLPAIMGCLNARLGEIEALEQVQQQNSDLIYSFDIIQATLKTLTSSLGNNQDQASKRLHQMVYELQVFIQRLGLEEDQEERVIAYVDSAVEESLELLDAGEHIFISFEQILVNLQKTIERQTLAMKRIESSQICSDEVEGGETNNQQLKKSADVELF